MMLEITAKHHFSIRQLYEYIASACGHWTLIGTPEQVVDQLQEQFENEAADRFNVLPPTTPAGLDDFVNFIIPELQRRGLFLTEYEGSTLRENLGLKRPVNQYLVTQPNTAIASQISLYKKDQFELLFYFLWRRERKIIASLSFLKFKYKKSAEADFNLITFNNLS